MTFVGVAALLAGVRASAQDNARAEGLKNSARVCLELQYFGPEPKKKTGLFLHSDSGLYKLRFPAQAAQISPEQRRKIVDYLAEEGFLDRAKAYDMAEPQYKGPTYVLRARWGKGFYAEELGWNLNMLRRLNGLRKVLDGEAGKAMDRVLASLQMQRKRWEQSSPQPSPEEKGRLRANDDIKAGKARILYYGKPWSVGKPLVDEATGLTVEIVEGCVVTKEFVAETDAYNTVVREWVLRSKKSAAKPAK